MKKQKLFILFSFAVLCLSGCSKTEKDNSFDTDLYGTYEDIFVGYNDNGNVVWKRNNSYILNGDNSYTFNYNETLLDETKKNTKNGKILNIDNINNDIQNIIIDETIVNLSGDTTKNVHFYKYKNMLGKFYETDVPNTKTFDLFLKNEDSDVNEGLAFNKDGQYHYCTNYDNCTDDSSTFTEYKHKGNYIYQADSDGNWTILLYVVDDGLFAKEYIKSER